MRKKTAFLSGTSNFFDPSYFETALEELELKFHVFITIFSLFPFFRSISGKLSTPRPASGSDGHHHMGGDNANSGSYPNGGTSGRFLLREDDVMQLEFNTNGLFSRSKPRRLILLNDLLVCVAVNGRSSEVDPSTSTSTSANERLTLKWAVPVSDVEVSQRVIF